jgi:hypothetical protein
MIAGLEDFEGLPWRPYFAYLDCDVPIDFELSVPQDPWQHMSQADGGYDRAASGEQESFVIRHDRGLTLNLRMFEEEYLEMFEPMLRTLWGQAQAFTVGLDANDVTTQHSCRLLSPWPPDGLRPQRDTEYPGMLNVSVDICTADGSQFPEFYYPTPDMVWGE